MNYTRVLRVFKRLSILFLSVSFFQAKVGKARYRRESQNTPSLALAGSVGTMWGQSSSKECSGDVTWVPVEVTAIHDGFMRAWQLGAKEWTENNSSGQAGFYPIQESWAVYQPVGLTGSDVTVSVPQSDLILHAYLGEVQKYLDTALAPRVATLQTQIKGGTNLGAMNNLGVLYAKYGQSDKAEQAFKQILRLKEYLPAVLNLGHLYYSRKDWKNALAMYQRASEANPDDPHTLLALARVNQELQNYTDAKKSYGRLKAINPTLAGQFAYLGEAQENGTRAADVESERAAVIWETDQ